MCYLHLALEIGEDEALVHRRRPEVGALVPAPADEHVHAEREHLSHPRHVPLVQHLGQLVHHLRPVNGVEDELLHPAQPGPGLQAEPHPARQQQIQFRCQLPGQVRIGAEPGDIVRLGRRQQVAESGEVGLALHRELGSARHQVVVKDRHVVGVGPVLGCEHLGLEGAVGRSILLVQQVGAIRALLPPLSHLHLGREGEVYAGKVAVLGIPRGGPGGGGHDSVQAHLHLTPDELLVAVAAPAQRGEDHEAARDVVGLAALDGTQHPLAAIHPAGHPDHLVARDALAPHPVRPKLRAGSWEAQTPRRSEVLPRRSCLTT